MIYLKILKGICLGILLSRWHDSLILKTYPELRKNRMCVSTYRLTISDFPHISRNRWDIIELLMASFQASFFLGGMILLRAHISLTFRKVSGFIRNIKNCIKNARNIYLFRFYKNIIGFRSFWNSLYEGNLKWSVCMFGFSAK